MGKHQNYINYISDNLIKNTEIDFDKEVIVFPFMADDYEPYPFNALGPHRYISLTSSSLSGPVPPFFRYCRDFYGAKEKEMNLIWDSYSEKLRSLIYK